MPASVPSTVHIALAAGTAIDRQHEQAQFRLDARKKRFQRRRTRGVDGADRNPGATERGRRYHLRLALRAGASTPSSARMTSEGVITGQPISSSCSTRRGPVSGVMRNVTGNPASAKRARSPRQSAFQPVAIGTVERGDGVRAARRQAGRRAHRPGAVIGDGLRRPGAKARRLQTPDGGQVGVCHPSCGSRH